ncbi:MAG: tRNA (guanosine(46)-N7)-methyltransferase TrmB [Brevundimonas sp.]|uniref:tRNA (guanosine(46)-N7)-methyltransferase TrmB n=1 Tax=Brevundimonas sp. TaxID=1871086 RepID=UPI00403366F2
MPASKPSDPDADTSAHRPLRTFGRIKSRPIKPLQAALFDSLLPSIAVPDPAAGPIDPMALMAGSTSAWLEIGFGGGEHLAAQAARNPDTVILGCEPFLNGVASLLRHVDEGGLKNVRIHADDARAVVQALNPASLDRVMILFPDPWHKARHNKRRLVQDEFVADLVRVLKPGGRLRFVTDWENYADWAREKFDANPALQFTGPADRHAAPDDHVVTRYEEKKLGDIAPIFLDFVRI